MARNQKDFVIQSHELREKYRIARDSHKRIAAVCKAIGVHTNCKIDIQAGPGGRSVRFELIGSQNGIKNAQGMIQDNFCQQPSASNKNPRRSGQAWNKLTKTEQKKFYKNGMSIHPEQPLLTEEALRQHNLKNDIFQLREFACGDCQFKWWKSVLVTKPVSTCSQCGRRYDALPRDKEFGIGRYICRNNHTFHKFCHATQERICRECRELVSQPHIHPDLEKDRPRYPGERRGRLYNPESPVYIFNPSTLHISTGSTVCTFLTQSEGAVSTTSSSYGDSDSDDESQWEPGTPTPHQSDEEDMLENSHDVLLGSESETDSLKRKRPLHSLTHSEDDSEDDNSGSTATSSPCGDQNINEGAGTI